MNDLELTSKEIAEIRLKYPPGTRLMLIIMEDSYAVPSGTRGTVDHVDDVGQIHMNWDNGRSLAIVPQIDQFRKLTKFELMEEADPSVLPHPKLLGYSQAGGPTELNSIVAVAEYICENGKKGNVQIYTEDGKPFISTYGVFLDRIANTQYRDALLRELIPRQMGQQELSPEEMNISQQM